MASHGDGAAIIARLKAKYAGDKAIQELLDAFGSTPAVFMTLPGDSFSADFGPNIGPKFYNEVHPEAAQNRTFDAQYLLEK